MSSEWISVQERLPEISQAVLGTDGVTTRIGRAEVGSHLVSWYDLEGEPTHWMPLPPPPEPQLTVKEALREAMDMLSHLHGVGYDKKDGTWYMPTAWMVKVAPLLPRLRAALEAE